ncbi:MAG: VacJ family lipoprotein [Rhodospirillales bacterium]|nr:VacJ family lipoprotein [Rhodospirillales bacterium]
MVRLLMFLVFLLAPAVALAALPPHIAKRIQRVVHDSGETARKDAALDRALPNTDYAAANRLAAGRRAASRMSAVVIAAIAESTALTGEIVAAAVAAAPALRDSIVRDASAAYPGFADVIARAAGGRAPAPPDAGSTPAGAARQADDAGMAAVDAGGGEDIDDEERDDDPIEPVNRAIFEFNEWVIKLVVRPLAQGYRWLVPEPARDSVENVLHNLNSPRILANDLLQGELVRAWHTTGRFVVNSTVGVAGIFDVAERLELPRHKEDFGQTLAVWGVGEMMYLVLPLLGPSNPRDGVGKAVDGFLDPLNLWAVNTDREYISYARTGVEAIDFYEGIMDELDDLRDTSVDYYAAIRSLYRQRRTSEIRNGEASGAGAVPGLEYDLDDEDFE